MAGGKGERLYPLTKKIPKPLMKIKGKSLLEILITKLYSSGINQIKNICSTICIKKLKII